MKHLGKNALIIGIVIILCAGCHDGLPKPPLKSPSLSQRMTSILNLQDSLLFKMDISEDLNGQVAEIMKENNKPLLYISDQSKLMQQYKAAIERIGNRLTALILLRVIAF